MTLFSIFKKTILSPVEVAEKAISQKLVPPNNTNEFIKSAFSELVEQLQIDAYNIYLKEQRRSGTASIEKYIKDRLDPESKSDDVIEFVSSMFEEMDSFFLSLTQSRRTRAGTAFEVILKTLFRKLEYPFEEQQVINGKPDFLMPSKEYFDINPIDCIIFTAKRTLRERWRQIVTEGTRGLGFFLATIDEKVSSTQINEMLSHRIYLVVPERIKQEVKVYKEAPNVISFEFFFTHHLDPAMNRWKDAGCL